MPAGYEPRTVLQRVLVLERTQGFQDRAAMGGLASFARQQARRAGSPTPPQLDTVSGILEGYSSADRRDRERAVAEALHVLRTGSPAVADSPTDPKSVPIVDPPESTAAPAAVAPQRPRSRVVHLPEELDEPITALKGMRQPMAQPLQKLSVATIHDLLYYLPRTHYDYADTRSIGRLRLGQRITLVGTILNVRTNRTGRGIAITTVTVGDDTGTAAVRWFNQPYIAKYLPVGARVAVSGEPEVFHGYITLQPREYELIEEADLTHTGRLVPMYPLTKGLYQRSLRKMIRAVVEGYASAIEDPLPDDLRSDLRLPQLPHAIQQFHFPANEEQRAWAEQRLAFDELLLVQLGLLQRKQSWQQPDDAVAVAIDERLQERFLASLPFSLTRAQTGALAEILRDMSRPLAMSRLLEGDVGSGKTVVGAAALLQVVNAGRQAVMMAPTEILAEQHHRTLQQLLEPFGVQCHLLVGSMPRKEKLAIYAAARDGSARVVVGTHALIQEGIDFDRLGLAITDEQHRFGVEQRGNLRQKGSNPHILAMTATPIPRTLAMTIYGDLDVSPIDELPPGRLAPITTWSRRAAEAYTVIRDEVGRGHQAFVICPVIEESADGDMKSALAEHRELASLIFPDLRVGLLHGKMKSKEKEASLRAFRQGECEVLVATSVVEVGIDVPNATVMVILDAHRFGLAQLHQFRGRVGRGGDQAYCVLLSDTEGDDASERLRALTMTENGFELAEQDLRLRGPGEFWGTRQSGLPELKVAKLGDLPTIQLARQAAQHILADDPTLARPEHALLKDQVRRFWAETADFS